MPTYKLTPAARRDLQGIWRYTHQEWGVEQADSYIDALDDAFKLLADMPLMARERTEFSPPVRIHPCLEHLVVYIQSETGILVVRVLHKNMNIDDRLSDLPSG